MKIGYARVSTTGQKLEVQLDKLTAAGCERNFEEKKSGGGSLGGHAAHGRRDERETLRQALTFILEGDQFVITRLDRLARSVLDLSQIAAEIAAKKVDLIVLDKAIDTGSPTGRLLIHLLAAIGISGAPIAPWRLASEPSRRPTASTRR